MHLSCCPLNKQSLQPYILQFSCAFSATFKWCTVENAVQTAAHYMMLSVSVAMLTSVLTHYCQTPTNHLTCILCSGPINTY